MSGRHTEPDAEGPRVMRDRPEAAGTSASRRKNRGKRGTERSVRARRVDVGGRTVAAMFGGYAVAAIATVFLALYLPLARSEATTMATLLSFVIYTGAVIWAFTASSMSAAWIGISVPAAAMLAVLLLVGSGA